MVRSLGRVLVCAVVACVVGGGTVAVQGVASASGMLQTTLPITGLSFPHGVAVDGNGDVFVAGGNQVVELLDGGAQVTLPFTGLGAPTGVAVDGNGDVFVTDALNNQVVELPNGCLLYTSDAADE